MKICRGTPALYFKSLNQHFTVLGVERQLFYLCVGLSLPIAFSSRLLPFMDAVSALVFLILYGLGIMITRADYQMLSIYRRHIHYKKFYNCHAGIHAPILLVKQSVPFYLGKKGLI